MSTQSRLIGSKRKFDGEGYSLYTRSKLKSRANKSAELWRKRGWKVRIIKDSVGYLNYKRRK